MLNPKVRNPAHFNIYFIVVMDRYKISRGEQLQECKWEKKPKSKSPGSTWNPGAELISTKNVILFPKLFWTIVRKNCSSDREKLMKYEAEGQEFAKVLKSLEQFIWTVKGQNNFWNRMLFNCLLEVSDLINSTLEIQLWKKIGI